MLGHFICVFLNTGWLHFSSLPSFYYFYYMFLTYYVYNTLGLTFKYSNTLYIYNSKIQTTKTATFFSCYGKLMLVENRLILNQHK